MSFITELHLCLFVTGNEILPCSDDHTKDICHPCPLELVQPNYIQSTQDTKQTECFENKNKDKCHASGMSFFFSKF